MKRLDKLIIGAFLGPFFLTFSVALFIFLTQYLLRYLDDFLGKDLGLSVFSELVFYFSMNMVPNSLPLAILISSLMTFGNLGEHHELTAIKSSGISLIRAMAPIFFIVIGIAVGLFYFNNFIVPKANLRAYSLLYDIRQKKPALNIKEGIFYNGLPGYSVKVTKKYPDGKTLKGVMIYNHTEGKGNTDLIVADSGHMYTFNSERYLALELYNGIGYTEVVSPGNSISPNRFVQNEFQKSKIVFSLASFDLKKTQQELFANNKHMKNVWELDEDVDSMRNEYGNQRIEFAKSVRPFYTYHFNTLSGDTINSDPSKSDTLNNSIPITNLNKAYSREEKASILSLAVNQARNIKSFIEGNSQRLYHLKREGNSFEVEKNKKYVQSVACLIMFLIGASLGTIIRKGGLGIPIFIGIIFFIIFYVLSMIGEKWAKESIVVVPFGMWMSMMVLLPVGIYFMIQAKNDARLFEMDAYKTFFNKLFKKSAKNPV